LPAAFLQGRLKLLIKGVLQMVISKKLKYKTLIFFVVLLSILNIAVATDKSIAQDEKAKIRNNNELPPDSVLNVIKKKCSNCKVITLNDLVDEAREEFIELYPKANPGWIKGDFNGDGLLDYAVLLYNKETGKVYTRLIVLLATGEKSFAVKTLIKPYEGSSVWYLGLMQSGAVARHTRAFSPPKNEPKETLLKYPGIKYYKAGSHMSVFYFENGTFKPMPVSY
jgi:hypothetical protein